MTNEKYHGVPLKELAEHDLLDRIKSAELGIESLMSKPETKERLEQERILRNELAGICYQYHKLTGGEYKRRGE